MLVRRKSKDIDALIISCVKSERKKMRQKQRAKKRGSHKRKRCLRSNIESNKSSTEHDSKMKPELTTKDDGERPLIKEDPETGEIAIEIEAATKHEVS